MQENKTGLDSANIETHERVSTAESANGFNGVQGSVRDKDGSQTNLSVQPDYGTLSIACLSDRKIRLMFDYAEMGLNSFGKSLDDFEIAGDDKVFYPATATINNDVKNAGITVWSDHVKNPVSVRYAFKSYVKGSLFNTYGLPASSFRTDDW